MLSEGYNAVINPMKPCATYFALLSHLSFHVHYNTRYCMVKQEGLLRQMEEVCLLLEGNSYSQVRLGFEWAVNVPKRVCRSFADWLYTCEGITAP